MPTLLLPDMPKDTKLSRSHELGLLPGSCLVVPAFSESSPANIQNPLQVAKDIKGKTKNCLTNELKGL